MKKVLSIILSICLVFSISVIAFASDGENGKLVVLGDSIAQGYGIKNSDEACFGKILADTIGYSYANFGHDGDMTSDLLRKLNSNYHNVAKTVKQADIIIMSIGGNDFMQKKLELPRIVAKTVFGNTAEIDEINSAMVENFALIIAKIKELNSSAKLFVQTLYNGQPTPIKQIYDLAVKRVNSAINGYLSENEGAYTIVDVKPIFENHREYIAVDTLHPSAVGNVAIAQVYLETFSQMGITDASELVINARGVDQIDGFSYRLKKFFDFFRKLFHVL